MASDLLPPNATPLERGLAGTAARIDGVPQPLPALARPGDAPANVLPWLAWGLSVFRWDAGWSEARRRATVAGAIADHKSRGSRASMDILLADYDARLSLTEWHEPGGSGVPRSFTVSLPLNGADPAHTTASFSNRLLADIDLTKPAGTRPILRQDAMASASLPITVAGRAALHVRSFAPFAEPDASDLLKLQTEYGEPIEGGEGIALEDH